MLTFDIFLAAADLALEAEYPALIAAWVAFKSIKYSSTNLCCFAVNFATISPTFFLETIDFRTISCYNVTIKTREVIPAGKYEKKPTKRIDWSQTIVNGLVSLIVGLILMLIEKNIE